jgi:hypothetical protein
MRVIIKVVVAIHLVIAVGQSNGFAAKSVRSIGPCPRAFCVPKASLGSAAILVAGEAPRSAENDQSNIAPPTYIPSSQPDQWWLLKLIGYLVGTVVAPSVLIGLLLSLWLTRFVKRRSLKFLVGVVSAIITLPVGFVVYSLSLWIASFIDPAPAQDDCALRSVSKVEYRRLLAQANAQDWTVWPGLSNGILQPWPPWEVARTDSLGYERGIGERLKYAVEQLSFDHGSVDAQLAAAHAVMRSIHAEYVRVNHIPSFGAGQKFVPESIHFGYFVPQRRFAPLCLPCLVFPFTTMQVVFYRDVTDTSYFLERIVVLHGGLKYDPQKKEEQNAVCPEFPTTPQH